ncbi:hypothetical protein INR49_012936 [Caranx melampygus]|nr:hypothetical protein INR49_012936 [Caranx melampygus]
METLVEKKVSHDNRRAIPIPTYPSSLTMRGDGGEEEVKHASTQQQQQQQQGRWMCLLTSGGSPQLSSHGEQAAGSAFKNAARRFGPRADRRALITISVSGGEGGKEGGGLLNCDSNNSAVINSL